IFARTSLASSVIVTSSSLQLSKEFLLNNRLIGFIKEKKFFFLSRKFYRIVKICLTESSLYRVVLIINKRSNKSIGIPCGLLYFVPRILVIPRFEAIMTIGDLSSSRARFKNEKHSISSIWTSSIKST